jgi:hypothetical protein
VSRYQGTYAAISDPPPGARPARATGVRMTHSEADYFRLVGQVADWKAEADRLQRIAVARGEEGDAFERERDEAVSERDHLREVIAFVLTEHHLGYCTLGTDTLTILWAVVCKKKEEEPFHG